MRSLCFALAALALVPAAARAAPSADQLVAMLKVIDDRQHNTGDYKALIYLEQKEKDKADTVHEGLVYRRDVDEKLMILFTKPKAEAGKGYLRLDKNLWSYDPNTGRWERTTERERIAGTDSRRADFDQSTLAQDYVPNWVGEEHLGHYTVNHLKLTVRDGRDVAYPVVQLWIDEDSQNVLKRQDFALSGRLMRTEYYPRWTKLYSPSKKGDFWYPPEIHIFDEVEKANSTLILIKGIELDPLQENLFTKAWVESKAR